jgi:hypothetical protein
MTVRSGTHWAEYNDSQRGREVRPLCSELIALAGDGAGRDAIDLGCGAGIETRVTAARALFDGLDVLRFTEVEEDGAAYSGTKHWHTFNAIARMPATAVS